jgi:hypothetical protein
VHIFDPHQVLFGLVTGKDYDFARLSHLARQQAADQNLTKGPSSTSDKHHLIR